MKTSYKIATVWGIPIKVHISLLIIMIILMFPGEGFAPSIKGPAQLLWGFLAGVGIFTSIALHELGHSLIAIKKGCRVRQITLMCLGGMAQMEKIPTKPMDEFLMAIAGPAVSLAISGISFGLLHLLAMINTPDFLLALFLYLAVVNIVLLIFNLIPAFPMDGGRVFRAALTPRYGRLKATFIAARLGQILAIAGGIYAFRNGELILIAIAFFIYMAAKNEYRAVQMQEAMKRQSFGFTPWEPIIEEPSETEDDDDQVIISPPPYNNDAGTEKTDIQHIDKNPFHRFF